MTKSYVIQPYKPCLGKIIFYGKKQYYIISRTSSYGISERYLTFDSEQISKDTDVQEKRLLAYLKQVLGSREFVVLILNSSIIYYILLQFILLLMKNYYIYARSSFGHSVGYEGKSSINCP